MVAMNHLIHNPQIKHGKIRVAFTRMKKWSWASAFDVEAFGASFAYTMDGGPLGGLEYESFNAAGAKLTFNGTNTHPGTAKNKMRNATKLAMEFNGYLPVEGARIYRRL